jgi:hypothetical protein
VRKYRNRLIVGFATALVIYIGLLLLADSRDKFLTEGVLPQLRQYPALLLLPVILLSMTSWAFRFFEWQYFLGVVGVRDQLSVFDSLVILISGFALVVSPGKIAEVLKAVVIRAKTGFPVAKSVPVVIAERVVDGIAVLTIVFVAVIVSGDSLDLGGNRFLVFLSFGVLITGLIVVQIRPLAYFLLDIAAKLPLLKRIHHPLVDFYESSREIFKIRNVIPAGLMGVCAYTADSLAFTVILAGFGLPLTLELFLQATFISGVAATIGALSGVPNGAGVTEIANIGTLMAIVGTKHPEFTLPMAATASLLQGFFHKWMRVLVGLGVGFIFRKRLFSETMEDAIAELETKRETQPAVTIP